MVDKEINAVDSEHKKLPSRNLSLPALGRYGGPVALSSEEYARHHMEALPLDEVKSQSAEPGRPPDFCLSLLDA